MSESVTNQYQPSLTEWLAAIGETANANAFRDEDNRKGDRLGYLKQHIRLPYRTPLVFAASDARTPTPEFRIILDTQGNESCAFRLVPDDPALPKLRNRGLTIKRCYHEWFVTLDIDFNRYTLSIFPNEPNIAWSTIFVVNHDAIFGEIIRGPHSQLTQGETQHEAMQFYWDFQTWHWSHPDKEAQEEIEVTLKTICVTNKDTQAQLTKDIEATFSHNYLVGYFESTAPVGEPEYFIDYNRLLPTYIPTPQPPTQMTQSSTRELKGTIAYKGEAQGKVVVITNDTVGQVQDFPAGSILVCDNTDVRYLPYMQKASAILTERGGMLSHAAIIARELKKPCVVGVKNLLATLKDGDTINVNANTGTVVKN